MITRSQLCCVLVGGLLAAFILTATSADASTVEVLDQNRSVNAFVIVPPCEESVFDGAEAKDFDPFDATAETGSSCARASGHAVADQQSFILGNIFEVHQATTSMASSKVSSVLHAISGSTYSVTFEVTVPSRYALNAGLNAAGALPVVLSSAHLRLSTQDSTIVLQHTITPDPGGDPNAIVIELTGELAPGVYTFVTSTSTVIDAEVPPNGTGSASSDAILIVTAIADLNGDGAVNVFDLLILLSDWGECADPADCPSDLTGDGEVNVFDLLMLLASWS